MTLREKCTYEEFFWSVFSRIRTEYGDLRSKIQENTNQKISENGQFLCSVKVYVDLYYCQVSSKKAVRSLPFSSLVVSLKIMLFQS